MKALIFIKDCFYLIFLIGFYALCILNPWCVVFLIAFSFFPSDKKKVENKSCTVYDDKGREFRIII